MHVERFLNDFSRLMSIEEASVQKLALGEFLELHGYTYGARSALNIQMMKGRFPLETIHRIVVSSLLTPSPDMALNAFERLSAVIPPEYLEEVSHRRKRLSQFILVCGASPFLVNLIYSDPSLFRDTFVENRIDISRSESEMLSALRSEAADMGADFNSLLKTLRRFKRREILRIAARDLNGLAPLEEVMSELSSLAAASLQVAYETGRRLLEKEHGAPLTMTENGLREVPMTIIGMGKLGGYELNFSSDIDIIYFYETDSGETSGVDDGSGGVRGVISLHAFFNRVAELTSKALSQVTEDGFVFRVDVGLRPEGKSGDMAVSLRSAEIYYESWGQSWERTAMLKARPVAGSIPLGEQLLRSLKPFVYRKYLDYNLIDDMKSMKQKIDASLVRSMEGETNLKLGRGGIREIEFFIQALQLVYAGKNPQLRNRNSLQSLTALRDAGLISEEDYRKLTEAYRFLRRVEHRIQVVQERQTHNLPAREEELVMLARRCGFLRQEGVKRFMEALGEHRSNVSAIYGNLFHSRDEKLQQDVKPEALFLLDQKAGPDFVKDMLAELHFEDVDRAYENLLILRDGPTRGMTERSRRLLGKISPLLVQELFDSPDPDMALANLERFLRAVGTRSSIYALLAENRETLKLLVSLFGISEFLSKIIILHPELLESMPNSAYEFKGKETMQSELAGILAQTDYYEEQLDILRRYRNEEFLRIGMCDIQGKLGQSEIANELTLLAEACLEAAYQIAAGSMSRFGTPRSSGGEGGGVASLAIVAMGKMGGSELNYHSDLDIIFVYDHPGLTDGERQISNHEYFAKLAQKLISVLTMQTREGYVYKIDTRLRPSGNAGPLVTSLESFCEYHRREAQIWERQAMTKARVVLGNEMLAARLDEIISRTVYGYSVTNEGRDEIRRLRGRMELELAKETSDSYNIKTGRGGMVDVEFAVQYLQLLHGCEHPGIRSPGTVAALKEIRNAGLIPEDQSEILLAGYKFLRKLENRLRIIHDYSVNDLKGSPGYMNKLARRLGYDPKLKNPGEALLRDYEEITGKIRDCFDSIMGTSENPGRGEHENPEKNS